MTGVELCVAVYINPIFAQLPDSARNTAISLGAKKLGRAMPFWYVSGLLFLLMESAVRRHLPQVHLVWAASFIWAVVIVLTLIFLVPINNRVASASPSEFTEKLRQEHSLWNVLHKCRVVVLVLSVVMFLLGVLA
jgi:hypothetical protein